MSKKTKLATLAIMSTVILTACNNEDESMWETDTNLNQQQVEQNNPNSDYTENDYTEEEEVAELTPEEIERIQSGKWYAFESVKGLSNNTIVYGNKSNDIYRNLLNRITVDAKEKAQTPVTTPPNSNSGNNSSDDGKVDYTDDFNEKPTTPTLPNKNDGNTSNENKDPNNGYKPPSKEEGVPVDSGEVNFEVDSEYKDSTGTNSSKPSTTTFNVYNYVSKDTPVITGTNKETKIYDQLDKLTTKFVVQLESESIPKIISMISKDYKGKLLVDNFSYGKLDKTNDKFYLIEVEYLITKTELDKLKTFARTTLNESNSLTGKEKYSYINKKITALGEYDDEGTNIYSPFSLFNNGTGVCQAYTSLGQIVFKQLGVQNGIATGSLNGVPHTWNVVKVDGKVLHIDFTSNDTSRSENYLLLTERDISKSRTVNEIIM